MLFHGLTGRLQGSFGVRVTATQQEMVCALTDWHLSVIFEA